MPASEAPEEPRAVTENGTDSVPATGGAPRRAQLLHLSGPLRGRTITYRSGRLVLGSAEDTHVRFAEQPGIAPHHAELSLDATAGDFHIRALEGSVFVNHRPVEEIILRHEDLVQLGRGGPKVRFRIHEGERNPCKSVGLMLRDALEVDEASGIATAARSLARDLLTHASLTLKIGFPVAVIGIVFLVSYLGGWLGSAKRESVHARETREQAEAVEERLGVMREAIEAFRKTEASQEVSREEIDSLREELARRGGVVDEWIRRDAALRKVLDTYSRGVGLIFGIFTFHEKRGDDWVRVDGLDGEPLALEYMGSGFLATETGHVITNRHVAEPWWGNRAVAPLLLRKLRPKIVKLSITFPGKAPLDVDLASIEISPDGVDLAMFRVDVADVPVLPLFQGGVETLRGGRVVVLGYPTGLNAMLARAERPLVAEVMAESSDTAELIAEMAKRGMISPIITQGSLNETSARRLVYDAQTTVGGSGGPVFGTNGTVLGVNFAITRDFQGSNFGVPVSFVRKLLRR